MCLHLGNKCSWEKTSEGARGGPLGEVSGWQPVNVLLSVHRATQATPSLRRDVC